jgi:integrase/recombinase XerD
MTTSQVTDVTNALDRLMTKFIEERKYLKNVTPATIEYYHGVWNTWRPYLPQDPSQLTKAAVSHALMEVMKKGTLNTISVNTYRRGLNAFLKWMHLEEHIGVFLNVPALKEEKKVLQVFNADQVNELMRYRPQPMWAKRAQAVAILLLDTGLRINEALTLEKTALDLDNLLVRVMGKGRKERVVPISPECRRVMYQWLKLQPFELVFATSTGTVPSHTNSLRDFKKLCKKVGIVGVRCSWHTLRHTFATHYIRRGGDVFRLKQSLGHTTLAVTQRYVTISTADLSEVHSKMSLVAASSKTR